MPFQSLLALTISLGLLFFFNERIGLNKASICCNLDCAQSCFLLSQLTFQNGSWISAIGHIVFSLWTCLMSVPKTWLISLPSVTVGRTCHHHQPGTAQIMQNCAQDPALPVTLSSSCISLMDQSCSCSSL